MMNQWLRRILAVLVPVLALAGVPEYAAGQGACPGPADFSLRRMQFLLGPTLESARAIVGLGTVDSSQLRLLSSPGDTDACRQVRTVLNGKLDHSERITIYKAGGFYFVPASYPPAPNGTVFLNARGVTYVLNESFELLHTLAA